MTKAKKATRQPAEARPYHRAAVLPLARAPLVLVLGMHRSGTSLCSSILHKIGIDMVAGDDLVKCDSNQEGHWERWDVIHLHDEIMDQLGIAWDSTRPLPCAWWRDPALHEKKQRLADIVLSIRQPTPYGVKDPRILRLLPLWMEILSRHDGAFKPVLCVREPLQVAQSLEKRNGTPIEKGLLLWLRHYAELFLQPDIPEWTVVDYASWFSEPVATLANIMTFIGAAPACSHQVVDGVLRTTIRPDLQHNMAPTAENTLYGHLYNKLLDTCVSSPKRDATMKELRAFFAQFQFINESVPFAFDSGAVQAEAPVPLPGSGTDNPGEEPPDEALPEAHWAEEALRQKEEEVSALQGIISGMQDEMTALGAEKAHLLEQLAKRETRLLLAHKELAVHGKALSTAAAEVDRTSTALRKAQEALEIARVERDTVSQQVDLRFKGQEEHISALRRQSDEAGLRLDALDSRHKVLEHALRQASRRADAFETLAAHLGGRLAVLNGVLDRHYPAPHGFSASYYLAANPDVAEAGCNPWEHYQHYGHGEGRAFSWLSRLPGEEEPARLLSAPSGMQSAAAGRTDGYGPLFDADFYVRWNRVDDLGGMSAAEHFDAIGAGLGYWPNPLFDTRAYTARHRDLAGLNPLEHYCLVGEALGERPHPLFDPEFYLAANPDVASRPLGALGHFLAYGLREGRLPGPEFDLEFYLHWRGQDIPPDTPPVRDYFEHFVFSRSDALTEEDVSRMAEETLAASTSVLERTERPEVSVIIPVHNQLFFTHQCLRSLARHKARTSFEVIVVDDCSTDLTPAYLRQLPFVRSRKTARNLGFLRACNAGAGVARGRHLLFLNNDTVVLPGWLDSLMDIMNDEQVAVAGSKLLNPNGTLQEAGGILWADGSAWNYGRNDDPSQPDYCYVKDADYISGASLMVRRTFWEAADGFDERYTPAYCEDSDLAFTARKMGFKVKFQPASQVVHFEGQSHGRDTTAGLKQHQVLNAEKFFDKWKETLQAEHAAHGQDVFRARDRSRRKPHILHIDHYVPHFDQDAGSRTAFQYLQLFVDMGYQVTFVPDNFTGIEPYTRILRDMGVNVLTGLRYASGFRAWLEENGHHFDYAYVVRPHVACTYLRMIKQYTTAKIMYYGVDLHFLREERGMADKTDPEALAGVDALRSQELHVCRNVDVAYFPSCVEVNLLRAIDSSINVKYFPAFVYEKNGPKRAPVQETSGLLFVGGFQHPPNEDGVRWFLDNILPTVARENPEVVFNIAGSKTPEWLRELDSPNVRVLGFVSDEHLAELYRTVRMVVAPLRYGAGVKGKIVEAMHHGVPTLTTSIGIEGMPPCDGAVAVADDAPAFAQAVLRLYDDPAALELLSRKARAYVLEHFHHSVGKRLIEADFCKP